MLNQQNWIERAKSVFPAGGLGNFDPNIIIQRGEGARVWDQDNNEYVDLLIGSGPMLLGHGNAEVHEAVAEQLGRGTTFFSTNTAAIELAETIINAVPCAEQLRYTGSGGEADMYAMRLARAYTGRNRVIKFEGGYHGMSAEAQMSLAPDTLVDFPAPVPDSAGIPPSVQAEMMIAPFNDIQLARDIIERYSETLAAVIVEPLQRIIPPVPGFLETLRELCTRHGIVLIFDEVVTGFRLSYGGAQDYYGVVPDLTTLGKIIGGGFPLAAVVGSTDIMAHFDKSKVGQEGFLMQIGTLSGNPVAAVAGLKTLEILRREGQYQKLTDVGQHLMNEISSILSAAGHQHQMVGHPAIFEPVFSKSNQDIKDYRDIFNADSATSRRLNASLRRLGVFKSPAKIYASLALTEVDVDQVLSAYKSAASHL